MKETKTRKLGFQIEEGFRVSDERKFRFGFSDRKCVLCQFKVI